VDVAAAATGTLDLGFLDVRDVMLLVEFLVAVCAMEGVLRHSVPPRGHNSADRLGRPGI